MLHNVSKPKNIGTIVRSCCAFNVQKVFLISKDPEKKKNSKIMKDFGVKHGSQGTSDKIDYEFFFSIQAARDYFKSKNIKIVGIEIGNNARSVYSPNAFEGDTVFILGNEGEGMTQNLKDICDYFVYIPQYTNKTASLNVANAGSIIFSMFGHWAGYPESVVYGEKFRHEKHDDEDRKAKIEREKAFIGKRKPKVGEDASQSASQSDNESGNELPKKEE